MDNILIVADFLKKTIDEFKEIGIESAVIDAELLIAHALGTERFKLIADIRRELSREEIKKINRLLKRRMKFEPVSYIIGKREFYSLEFNINRDVLIPRPETELLVDLAIYYAKQDSILLDLGTGSGAIAVSVKHMRNDLDVHASDISEEALKVAEKNAGRILGTGKINFYSGDLFNPFKGMKFDVIVSNPPYINPDDMKALQKDIGFEPERALLSDDRGRGIIKRIIDEAGTYLNDRGILIIEIASIMKEYIPEVAVENGFSVSILNDYSGLARVAVLKV
ncbi:peptide chain release factor N(5)-glutamine methyltransferase [Spirochaetota bacterium]